MIYRKYSVYQKENDKELVNLKVEDKDGKFVVKDKLNDRVHKDISFDEAKSIIDALDLKLEVKEDILKAFEDKKSGILEKKKQELLSKELSDSDLEKFEDLERKFMSDFEKLLEKF